MGKSCYDELHSKDKEPFIYQHHPEGILAEANLSRRYTELCIGKRWRECSGRTIWNGFLRYVWHTTGIYTKSSKCVSAIHNNLYICELSRRSGIARSFCCLMHFAILQLLFEHDELPIFGNFQLRGIQGFRIHGDAPFLLIGFIANQEDIIFFNNISSQHSNLFLSVSVTVT